MQRHTFSQACYATANNHHVGNTRNRVGQDSAQLLSGDYRDGQLVNTRVLVDPLWQDLDRSYRLYLHYFDQRVCREYVSRDTPQGNPFRNLLPQAGTHPLLQITIVATSASHMSHLLRLPLCRSGHDNGGSVASGSERCQRAYRHALAAKHKALGMMRNAVVNIHADDCGAVLASVFFLVDLELMERGRASWKAHLKGAGRILSLFQPTLASAGPLADYLSADYLM
ncbi:hypothetical protein MY3296_006230 [Beauveria thailandica]